MDKNKVDEMKGLIGDSGNSAKSPLEKVFSTFSKLNESLKERENQDLLLLSEQAKEACESLSLAFKKVLLFKIPQDIDFHLAKIKRYHKEDGWRELPTGYLEEKLSLEKLYIEIEFICSESLPIYMADGGESINRYLQLLLVSLGGDDELKKESARMRKVILVKLEDSYMDLCNKVASKLIYTKLFTDNWGPVTSQSLEEAIEEDSNNQVCAFTSSCFLMETLYEMEELI